MTKLYLLFGLFSAAAHASAPFVVSNLIDQGLTASQAVVTDASKQLASVARGTLSDAGTDGIVVTNGGSSVFGAGTSLAQHVADASHNGFLSSTDWSTFNGKQAAGNYITALTGDGTASGPGSVALTLATVNGNVGSFTNGSFTVNGKGLITAASSGTAPVTSLTVASANGLAGSFSASTTPVLTLSTTVSGSVCANGTAFSACTTTGSGSTVLASGPTMTNPVVGTQSPGDNSTLAASTAFVTAAVAGAGGGCVEPVLTKTSSYAIQTADFTCANKMLQVEMNCASPCTLTLPLASNSGFVVDTVNIGDATLTVVTIPGNTLGRTLETTLSLMPTSEFPQNGQSLKSNGGTRWNGY